MFQKLNPEIVKKTISIIIETFSENEEQINNLNVFPVPDGDTGTNMLLTLKSIDEEINKIKNYNLKNISESVSFGGLMGARGNSGVILSQILKGFFDIIMQQEDIDLEVLKQALASSKEMAYSSVQNPTEGTMLTTIKDIHQALLDVVNGNKNGLNYKKLLNQLIKETEKSVTRTTYLLPVLKQADVVDAGAKGILVILQGLKRAMEELNMVDENINLKDKGSKAAKFKTPGKQPLPSRETYKQLGQLNVSADIKYTYCTELIVKGENINVERLKDNIESYGDSAMVVGNERVVKIHVHTNHPHKVLKRAIREGSLHEIQINNMVEQSKQAKIIEGESKLPQIKKVALVAVANGEGLVEIFKSIGVDYIISGGQTMNPSTYDMVKAINNMEAESIIILPNNKNIIATAKQCKRIVKKEVEIIPTETIVQGISSVLSFNQDLDIDENVFNMTEAVKAVKSGEITQAVRDANLLVGEIKKGEYIGLNDGKVRVISDNLVDATLDLVRDMIKGQEEVITFYAGLDLKKEEMNAIREKVKQHFTNLEVEFHQGGQPLYPVIFSIE
ncbi:MAG: DAK2 domain-containing protein [Actinomycetota bacterium]|jgi:DAK2 domain fusion protein YloV|nr:DAK2 domain-containing protein [Actinomycetota bacterium]